MLHRIANIPTDNSFFLFGPRQTGKSTLVRAALPPASLCFDLLRHDEFLRLTRNPSALRREVLAWRAANGTGVVLIDEVQKVPALLDEVHALIEDCGVRFWLTGSSARKLRRGGANLLAGRAVTRHLHPLTWAEMPPGADFDRMLRLGTLPAVATRSDDDAKDMLRTYADTYLREEIQAEALVRNLGGFARFLDVVAAQAGELLNHSAVARDADVANRTVIEYVQVLEDTLVGFRLPPWTRSLRARLVAHPKLYLFDNGVTNALRGRLDAGIDPVERGRLFEHWVVQEVRRLCDYHHPETRMYFWRTHNGAEVDLLLERHGRLRVAVEVKARAAVVSADLSGLRSFGDVHPDVPRVLVCTAARPSLCGDVLVLPQRDFFERLEDWLA